MKTALGSLMTAMAAALVASGVWAEDYWRHGERVALWPAGQIPARQAHQKAVMTDEAKTPGAKDAASGMPYLEWFDPPAADRRNGACMILVSGGGYNCCCDVSLVKTWRDQLTAAGYQCVNLVYRTPRPKDLPFYQTAWMDGQRAVRLVRRDAAKRGFDPERIGAVGMSAGGHLVVMLATSALTPAYGRLDDVDDAPCHLNWAVAHAPAYNTLNAAKGDATPQDGTTVVPALGTCFKFDAKTCPISFHHGGMDPYSPNGSTLVCRELRKRKIPCELHLYADKKHGMFGFERAIEFMRQMNYDRRLGKPRALDHRFMPGDTIRTEKEMLWPKGRIPDVSPNHAYDPYLVWFIPEKLATKAIQVIVPGGGYGFCNFNGEGTPVAHYLNGKGMTTVVVMYRCPRPVGRDKHVSAWQDAQRAIRLVRHEAPARGLDPNRIGIMGFSAGGHLALLLATTARTNAYAPVDDIDKLSADVQWACPIYPAYVLADGVHGVNLRGGNDDADGIVPDFAFDAATPPMCFLHGDGDAISCMGSVKCWEKLRLMGIQCDLHTLATRGHCFQIQAQPDTGSWTWLDRIWDFLSRKQFNK